MTRAQILPTVLIVIDIGAAFVYTLDGDIRRVVYWISAAVLTASITF